MCQLETRQRHAFWGSRLAASPSSFRKRELWMFSSCLRGFTYVSGFPYMPPWPLPHFSCWSMSLDNTMKRHTEKSTKHWFSIYQMLEKHMQEQTEEQEGNSWPWVPCVCRGSRLSLKGCRVWDLLLPSPPPTAFTQDVLSDCWYSPEVSRKSWVVLFLLRITMTVREAKVTYPESRELVVR